MEILWNSQTCLFIGILAWLDPNSIYEELLAMIGANLSSRLWRNNWSCNCTLYGKLLWTCFIRFAFIPTKSPVTFAVITKLMWSQSFQIFSHSFSITLILWKYVFNALWQMLYYLIGYFHYFRISKIVQSLYNIFDTMIFVQSFQNWQTTPTLQTGNQSVRMFGLEMTQMPTQNPRSEPL